MKENKYLIEAFKKLGKTSAEIQEDLEASQPYVSALINGKKKVGKNVGKKLEKLYGFDLAKILTGGDSEKEKNNVSAVPENDYMMVEFEDLETAAGKLGGGEIAVLPEKKKRLVPREYEKGDYLVVRVHGQSMNDNTGRSVYEDDELLIKQYYDSYLSMPIRTKLFVITTREGSVVKQITKINKESNTITCHSFNPLYEDYEIGIEELLQVFTVEKKVKSKIIF